MKNSLLITSIFISTLLVAQTKFTVTVSNGSFSPSAITIAVGDTVEWVNVLGIHWVDGTQATFPPNPVSFDNQSQSGAGWTYTQVFNTAGNYAYRCGIHTTTMFGGITVQAPTTINEEVMTTKQGFYPNPAAKDLFFPGYAVIENVVIYSITGEKVLESILVKDKLDISSLGSGTYFVKAVTGEGDSIDKLIIQ